MADNALFTCKWQLSILVSMLLICCLVDCRPVVQDFVDPSKFIFRRNFITRELFYKNLSRIDSPEPVRRIRLMVGASQAASASGGFAEVYRIKVRWIEPQFWWDNEQAVRNRFFELFCEAEDEGTGRTYTFVHMQIDSLITGYDEHFMARQSVPIGLRCGIRCVNGASRQSQWVWTNSVKLYKLYNRSAFRRHPQLFAYRKWQQQQQQQTSFWQNRPLLAPPEEQQTAADDEAAVPLSIGEDQQFHQQQQQQPIVENSISISNDNEQQQPTASSSDNADGQQQQEQPQHQQQFGRRYPQWELLSRRNSNRKTLLPYPAPIVAGDGGPVGNFS